MAFARIGKRRKQNHLEAVFRLHLVDNALLGIDKRRELREQHAADGAEIALALQHAREASEVGLEPVLLFVAVGREPQVVDHGVDVVFEFRDFAAGFDLNRSREVALGDGGGDFCNRADLVGEVVSKQVDVAGEVFPRTGGAGHVSLTAKAAFDADFAGDGGHLVGEGRQGVGHVVDGFGESGDFALRVHRKLLREFAVSDSRDDFHDAAHLLGEVGGHDVDVVGEVFPSAGDARNLRLTPEFSVGTAFARHAGDFGGERVELVHHRVDGVFQLENFALHVDRNLARQVAAGDGCRDFGDVSDLSREVAGHRVDRVREVLPRTTNSRHVGLTAEAAFGADFARDAGDFGGEGTKLLNHRVERFFELKDFAADVDRDFARKVAARDRGCDFRNVSHLAGEVAGHEVHVVGEIFPRTADTEHLCLAAQLPFRAGPTRHARDFAGERVELVHHRVDGVF